MNKLDYDVIEFVIKKQIKESLYSEPIKLDFIINLILHYYWIDVYTL